MRKVLQCEFDKAIDFIFELRNLRSRLREYGKEVQSYWIENEIPEKLTSAISTLEEYCEVVELFNIHG